MSVAFVKSHKLLEDIDRLWLCIDMKGVCICNEDVLLLLISVLLLLILLEKVVFVEWKLEVIIKAESVNKLSSANIDDIIILSSLISSLWIVNGGDDDDDEEDECWLTIVLVVVVGVWSVWGWW